MSSVTPIGRRRYDGYPAVEAVIMAWTLKGINPDYHDQMRSVVATHMPLLARALERMSREYPHGGVTEWAKKVDTHGFTVTMGEFECPNLEHEGFYLTEYFKLEDLISYVKEHYDCEALPNRSING